MSFLWISASCNHPVMTLSWRCTLSLKIVTFLPFTSYWIIIKIKIKHYIYLILLICKTNKKHVLGRNFTNNIISKINNIKNTNMILFDDNQTANIYTNIYLYEHNCKQKIVLRIEFYKKHYTLRYFIYCVT